MTKKQLKKIIREELLNENKSKQLFDKVLQFIRKESRSLSIDETHEFHEMLKDWVNRGI